MVPTVLVIWRPAGALNLLQLGEEEAHYLGVEVAVVQRLLLLCSALLVAAAVAVSGVIGFVGLVVPHGAHVAGADHRAVIPGSVLAGALLLLAADTLARTGRPGGNAGRFIDQSSRCAVVPVAYLSSRRCAWLNATVRKIWSFTPDNGR